MARPPKGTIAGRIAPTGAILSEAEVQRILKQHPTQVNQPVTLTTFQREVMLRQEKEVGLFGGRYGGKSFAARAFLLKGNPDLPDYDQKGQPIWANMSYIYHPAYHAIIVRKNRIDLEDFIKKFAVMSKPFGGEWKDGRFKFPSGAWIDCGHMEDSDAWQKYIGIEAIRFVFEEATLIPELQQYIQVLLSCRSIYPELRPQVLLTSNAIGPGFQWITERFIEAKDVNGEIIPPGTTIDEEFENPFNGQKVRTSRVWLKSTVNDNPYAQSDPSYIATLASIKDEKMRRAYLLGDWVSMTGQYFCLDDKSEILTEKGFASIGTVSVGDKVATLSPDGLVSFEPCSSIFEDHYDGEMFEYKSPKMDLCVTPNHRMYSKSYYSAGEFCFTPASDLSCLSLHKVAGDKWNGCSSTEIVLETENKRQYNAVGMVCPICNKEYQVSPAKLRHRRGTTCSRKCSYEFRRSIYGAKHTTKTIGEGESGVHATLRQSFNTNDFMELLGWYLSEGCLMYTYRNGGRELNGIVICQQKHKENLERIASLLSRMGIGYTKIAVGYRIFSVLLASYMKQFGHSNDKFIPRDVLGYSKEALERLLFGLLHGDGFKLKGDTTGWAYYTTSEALANNINELCVRVGRRCSITKIKQPKGREFGYRMYIGSDSDKDFMLVRHNMKRVAYSGRIWCVTVPPHNTIYVRRNGRAMWMGNSDFRPKGPLAGDPPEANHVVHEPFPTPKPWWHQSIGVDWGFSHEAAAYWLYQNPNTSQIHVFRELVVSGTGPEQLGYEIAERTRPALLACPGKQIILHLSPDAFQDRMGRNRSIAELIAQGMERVIGRNAIHLPDLDAKRLAESSSDLVAAHQLADEYLEKFRTQRRSGITIRIANDSRVIGWQFVRESMRFTPIGEERAKFDPEFAKWLWDNKGEIEYFKYWEAFRDQQEEVLPRLQIWSCCPRLIQAIPKAIHDEKKVEDVSKSHFSGMDSLDACLVAGTVVQTDRGGIPIEAIRVGDRVWTRKGLCRVREAGMTNENAPVFEVQFSNGAHLTGTGNHPIWREGDGFVRLDSLRYGDIMSTWLLQKSLSSTETNITECPIVQSGICGFTSGPTRNDGGTLDFRPSIKRYGKRPTGRSQKDTSSTIEMEIPSTTISPTLNASQLGSTWEDMPVQSGLSNTGNGLLKYNHLPKSGTPLRMDENGTQNMLIHPLPNQLRSKRSVRYVEQSTLLDCTGKRTDNDSVLTTARVPGEEANNSTLSRNLVPCAEPCLDPTSTTKINTVPVVVLGLSPVRNASVYNLSVDDAEEYYANGVLVHNCRYLLIGHRDEPVQEPFESYQERELDRVVALHPEYTAADLVWTQRHIEAKWAERRRGVGQPFSRPGAIRLRRSGAGREVRSLPPPAIITLS